MSSFCLQSRPFLSLLAVLVLTVTLHSTMEVEAKMMNGGGHHVRVAFDTTAAPVHVDPTMPYFESSWSILSCLCGLVAILSFSVMSVMGQFSNLGLVALVVSLTGCTANGLCFYAYYSEYSLIEVQVSAAFADIFWGIQEIGLSFYSMIILVRVLQKKEKLFYQVSFCLVVLVATAFRFAILAHRQIFLDSDPTDSRQHTINNMHSGYFSSIAALELINGIFLIRSFAPTKSAVQNSTELFRSIARSSELRLAFLFCTGFGRAVCYSYQASAQSAGNAAGQWDRFFALVECFYPTVFLVDLMAAKIASYGRGGGDRGNLTQLPSSFDPAAGGGTGSKKAQQGSIGGRGVTGAALVGRRSSIAGLIHSQSGDGHSKDRKVSAATATVASPSVELSNILIVPTMTHTSPSVDLPATGDDSVGAVTLASPSVAFHVAAGEMSLSELVAAVKSASHQTITA